MSADHTTTREPPAATEQDPRIGTVLHGTYRVVRRIGGGGMGTVYEAEHTRLQQRFALKFLDPQLVHDAEAYARFRQEAEIAASLAHDSIVEVYDFNTAYDDSPYMVLEYVEGVTLGEWMHGRRVPVLDVLRVIQPLCDALAAAHAAGIVHRDLKPSNVMVRSDGAGSSDFGIKLFDFGISKVAHVVDAMTRANVLMGTPHYMSPEQASGNAARVDAATDVFALGAILYEMLSGRPAFEQESTAAVLHAIVYEHPRALAELCPDLAPPLVAVVEKCLAKSPIDRFADTRTLLVALRAAVRGRPRRLREVAEVPERDRSSVLPWAIGWGISVMIAAIGTAVAVGHAPAPAGEVVTVRSEPVAAAVRPQDVAADPSWRQELATPGAFVLESGPQLYRADARGLSYWSDPEAETVMRPLPSAAAATALGRAREGDVIVGQADGTVSRWDRELRDAPWHQRIGTSSVHAVAASAGYLAIATGTDVHLVHAESGKPLRKFSASSAAVALLFTREPNQWLVIVRGEIVEVVDADKRKSLGTLPLAGRAARAAIAAEPLDDPAEIEIDFVQGDWMLRRKYRLHTGRKGQGPRLEPSGQRRI